MAFKDDPNIVWNQMRAISGFAEIADHGLRGMRVALPDVEYLPKDMSIATRHALEDKVYEMQKHLAEFNELLRTCYQNYDPG